MVDNFRVKGQGRALNSRSKCSVFSVCMVDTEVRRSAASTRSSMPPRKAAGWMGGGGDLGCGMTGELSCDPSDGSGDLERRALASAREELPEKALGGATGGGGGGTAPFSPFDESTVSHLSPSSWC